MLISPHYHDSDWKRLNLSDPAANEDDWRTAAEIVEDRIRGRLINWIDKLVSELFSGFAVLALDCILIESLWGFETGKKSPGNKDLYSQILNRPRFRKGGFNKAAANSFCGCIRNGIAHDSETRKGWLIGMTIPEGKIVERTSSGEYRLNRTEFHKAVVNECEDWMKSLKCGADGNVRQKMRNRMEQIINIHFAT